MKTTLLKIGLMLAVWALSTSGAVLRTSRETTYGHLRGNSGLPRELDKTFTPGQQNPDTGQSDLTNQRPRSGSRSRTRREFGETLDTTSSPSGISQEGPGLERDTDNPQGVYYTLKELRAMKPGPGVQHRVDIPAVMQGKDQDLRRRRHAEHEARKAKSRGNEGRRSSVTASVADSESRRGPNVVHTLPGSTSGQKSYGTHVSQVLAGQFTGTTARDGVESASQRVGVRTNSNQPEDGATRADSATAVEVPQTAGTAAESKISVEQRGEQSLHSLSPANESNPQLFPPGRLAEGKLSIAGESVHGRAEHDTTVSENLTQSARQGVGREKASDGQMSVDIRSKDLENSTIKWTQVMTHADQHGLRETVGNVQTLQTADMSQPFLLSLARRQHKTGRLHRSNLNQTVRKKRATSGQNEVGDKGGDDVPRTSEDVKDSDFPIPTALERLTNSLQHMKTELEGSDHAKHLAERAAEHDPDSAKKSLSKEIMTLMKDMESRPDNWLENQLKLIDAESRALRQKAMQLHHKLIEVGEDDQGSEPYPQDHSPQFYGERQSPQSYGERHSPQSYGERQSRGKDKTDEYPDHHIDMRVKIHRSGPRSSSYQSAPARMDDEYSRAQDPYRSSQRRKSCQIGPLLDRIEEDLRQLRSCLQSREFGMNNGYDRAMSAGREPSYSYPGSDSSSLSRYRREQNRTSLDSLSGHANKTGSNLTLLSKQSPKPIDEAKLKRNRRAAEDGDVARQNEGESYHNYILQLRRALSQRGLDASRTRLRKTMSGKSMIREDMSRHAFNKHLERNDNPVFRHQSFLTGQDNRDIVTRREGGRISKKGNNSVNDSDTSELSVAPLEQRSRTNKYGHTAHMLAHSPADITEFLKHFPSLLAKHLPGVYGDEHTEQQPPNQWRRPSCGNECGQGRKPKFLPFPSQFPYAQRMRARPSQMPFSLRKVSQPSAVAVETVKVRLPSHAGSSNGTVHIQAHVQLQRVSDPHAPRATMPVSHGSGRTYQAQMNLLSLRRRPSAFINRGSYRSITRHGIFYHPPQRNSTASNARESVYSGVPEPGGEQFPRQYSAFTSKQQKFLSSPNRVDMQHGRGRSAPMVPVQLRPAIRRPMRTHSYKNWQGMPRMPWPYYAQRHWEILGRQSTHQPVESFKNKQADHFPDSEANTSHIRSPNRGSSELSRDPLSVQSQIRSTTAEVKGTRQRKPVIPVELNALSHSRLGQRRPSALREYNFKTRVPQNTISNKKPHRTTLHSQQIYPEVGRQSHERPVKADSVEAETFTLLPDEVYSRLIEQIMNFPHNLFRRRRRGRNSPWEQDQEVGEALLEPGGEQWPAGYYGSPGVQVPMGIFGTRRRRGLAHQHRPSHLKGAGKRLRFGHNRKAGTGNVVRGGRRAMIGKGKTSRLQTVRSRIRRKNTGWKQQDPVSEEERGLEKEFRRLLKDFRESQAEHALEERMEQEVDTESRSADMGQAIAELNKEPTEPFVNTEDAGDLFLSPRKFRSQGRTGGRGGQGTFHPSHRRYFSPHRRHRLRRQVRPHNSPSHNTVPQPVVIQQEVDVPDLSGMGSATSLAGTARDPIADVLNDENIYDNELVRQNIRRPHLGLSDDPTELEQHSATEDKAQVDVKEAMLGQYLKEKTSSSGKTVNQNGSLVKANTYTSTSALKSIQMAKNGQLKTKNSLGTDRLDSKTGQEKISLPPLGPKTVYDEDEDGTLDDNSFVPEANVGRISGSDDATDQNTEPGRDDKDGFSSFQGNNSASNSVEDDALEQAGPSAGGVEPSAYDYFHDDDDIDVDGEDEDGYGASNYDLDDENSTDSQLGSKIDYNYDGDDDFDDDHQHHDDDQDNDEDDDTMDDDSDEESDDKDSVERRENGIEVDDRGHKVEPKENFALLEKDPNKLTDYTWAEWSTCSVTCGVGRRYRANLCGPAEPCKGAAASQEVEVCSLREDCSAMTVTSPSAATSGPTDRGNYSDGLTDNNLTSPPLPNLSDITY